MVRDDCSGVLWHEAALHFATARRAAELKEVEAEINKARDERRIMWARRGVACYQSGTYQRKTEDLEFLNQKRQEIFEMMATDLREEILQGRLYAYGSPDRGDATPVRILPDTFALLRSDPDQPDRMCGGNCLYWNVRVRRGKQEAVSQEAVNAWMLRAAQDGAATGRLLKRTDALQECRKANQCSHRAALAAWNALPPEVRRTRGKPRKTA